VSRASIVGAKAKTPAQAPPKSSSFRDSAGKKRYRPGSKALKEIRHYQRGIMAYNIYATLFLSKFSS
jgi:hypothetical protein